ncbi:5'-deoxynucleotidase KNAG_0F02290 [Huiozyma naganishii CBS 8797]|uniref:5'-deoxynucleotidase n=1 Tax=Huiozyma naganishii (strain ATCC MYA-139 / BCRC 22969 / CBS 8797 / KCTC 17520 / NBRC 10181 / NCYC 3082 / Yp74L-3) TaxID=1071383 RepID=J7S7C2_HUIN7|nr:hypothetical protein KNAG_0F02290 [Kazachstania naganishii CBS 8797]CCK70894.1 hypothetical protein KNAG_0F02290 [Kazachstania naganishii CBS 8797]
MATADQPTQTDWDPAEKFPAELLQLSNSKTPLVFFHALTWLKSQRRTGWLQNGIPQESAESISDHMHRMSLMALCLRTGGIDPQKCAMIAMAHDVAECLVGDITPQDKSVTKWEKHLRELKAMQFLCGGLLGSYNAAAAEQLMDRWLDYEEQRCLEAVYCKDLDKFEMLVQCFEYEKQYRGEKKLEQFYSSAKDISTDEVGQWLQALLEERRAFFASLTQ